MRNEPKIRVAETATYDDVWTNIAQYSKMSPGALWAKAFHEIVRNYDTRQSGKTRVLDAGCGSGKGALALQDLGYDVVCCDLTDAGLVDEAREMPFVEACLWHHDLPRLVFDWAFCCDVMEHIPKEFTMLVVARLLDITRRGVFLSITFEPDNFGQLVGRPLHQTVESFTWWKDRLNEIGHVVDARDLLQSGLFLVERRA